MNCHVHHHRSHSVRVTKSFYVKVFSLMDARKAKLMTDELCGLEMAAGWDRYTLHSSDREHRSLPTGRKKTNSWEKSARIPWCNEDERLLVEAVRMQRITTPFPARFRWLPIIVKLRGVLETERTPGQLKDKYRNLRNAKSKKSLFL